MPLILATFCSATVIYGTYLACAFTRPAGLRESVPLFSACSSPTGLHGLSFGMSERY